MRAAVLLAAATFALAGFMSGDVDAQTQPCRACGSPVSTFPYSYVCFEPTCCSTSQVDLVAACASMDPLLAHPVPSACRVPVPNDNDDSNGLECLRLDLGGYESGIAPVTLACAFDGQPELLDIYCCEMGE